jgi:aspartyl-tRNA(Asn)/glutamyl-tRNA(Gln) amidotransferase subunit A
MSRPSDASSEELAAAFATGDLSPVEAAQSVLDRIDAWEPKINAMFLVHRESALAAARESEKRWKRGEPRSPLDGVPITIKENIYTRGDPAPIGTSANPDVLQPLDAPVAARVREAGCVIVGKTTMPDYGMLSSGMSSRHGVTRNPWRLDRNPSGSSSGAGAACAAGYGPLHVGTDIGGSVRLPATHCGIFGLKPSQGRVPVYPPYLGRVAGPMTRSVRDAALLMNVLTGPDVRDFMSLPAQAMEYRMAVDGLSPKALRIALLLDMKAGLPVDPEVRAAAEAAAQALRTAGAYVDVVESFLTEEMLEGVFTFFEARSFNEVSVLDEPTRSRILPFIVEWCTWRAGDFSGSQVMGALTQIMAMRDAATRFAADYDFVISPTSPLLPYDAQVESPTRDPHNALAHIAFTVPWNMSEHPAASVNWGFSREGLPIGVQVVGQRFDDIGVLRLSRALEILRPEQQPWPEPEQVASGPSQFEPV